MNCYTIYKSFLKAYVKCNKRSETKTTPKLKQYTHGHCLMVNHHHAASRWIYHFNCTQQTFIHSRNRIAGTCTTIRYAILLSYKTSFYVGTWQSYVHITFSFWNRADTRNTQNSFISQEQLDLDETSAIILYSTRLRLQNHLLIKAPDDTSNIQVYPGCNRAKHKYG